MLESSQPVGRERLPRGSRARGPARTTALAVVADPALRTAMGRQPRPMSRPRSTGSVAHRLHTAATSFLCEREERIADAAVELMRSRARIFRAVLCAALCAVVAVAAGLVAPALARAETTASIAHGAGIGGGRVRIAAAPAARTVGEVSSTSPLDLLGCGGQFSAWVQLASNHNLYTVPVDGVITSWSFRTGPSADVGLYLVVYRGGPAPDANLDGSGRYTFVDSSAAGTQQANQLRTYPAKIPVKAGDVLGVATNSCLYAAQSGTGLADIPFRGSFAASGPGTDQFFYGPLFAEFLQLSGFNGPTYPGLTLPISAQLQPTPPQLQPVVVQTSSLPPVAVGLPYSQQLKALGGTGTYTWSVASGALPSGLSLSSGGVLSGTPTGAGTARFTVEATDSARPTAHVATRGLPLIVYPAPTPAVWVANGGNSAINAFALNANGDVAPMRTLAGSLTGLNGPDGLAFDSVGDLYVADSGTPAVTEYGSGAYGDIAPIRTINGPATGLVTPAGVALDSAGNFYVANEAAQTVTVYGPGANGDVAPIRTISGPDTQLSQPWGLAIDAAGNLWVANYASSTLTEYPAGARGDASPMAAIGGPSTLLSNPMGLARDATGHLIAANLSGGSVSEFPGTAPFGDKVPSLWIGGTASGLVGARGVDVDAANRLYVTNQSGVNVFSPRAGIPKTIISSGPTSGISGADAVAVAPPLVITTPKLPTAALGYRYRERVGAILGRGTLRWRMVRGRLPRGLHIDAASRVRGVPRQLGTFRFTVAVRDSSSPAMTATRTIALTVRRPPVITSVLTHTGPTRGGQRVTVLGRDLAPGSGNTTVAFGHIRALHALCVGTARCTATTPPHTAGTVQVTVTVHGLTSAANHAARYTYRRR